MAERLLVTGATGFVGRGLPAALAARGAEVHAVAHRAPPPARPGVTWHRADLLDEAEGRALLREVRPAVVVHAAWYVVHGRFWTAPENQDWLEASTAFAAAFAQQGGRRFIGLGTCVEYAASAGEDDLPWPETRPLAPETPYGRSKAELATRLAALAARQDRFETAWARVFHLFGPGEAPGRLVPSVALALLEGREAACGSGLPVRDFASTWHVAEAIAALATSGVTGPVNIGAGVPMAIRALVERVAAIVGRPDLLRLGALPDRPGEVPRMVADITRLRREVGFATPAPIEADLARVIAGLRAAAAAPAG